jgi:predicted RNase H-like HicB family nuclease
VSGHRPVAVVLLSRRDLFYIHTLEARLMKIKVIIHEAEEGGFWAEVPGFPGCVSEGDSLDEVRANIRDALEGVLTVMQDKPIQ